MRFSLLSPQRGLQSLALLALGFALAGCTAGTRDDAARGAKVGAVGGLVAGAVGSIFWGGDAVNNALRSAAVGAASGAAVGAVSGSGSSPAPAPAPAPAGEPAVADAALRARMGDLNFAAGEELARCRHMGAISRAEKAFASETDPERRSYALLIQAMAAEESGNTAQAAAVYGRWAAVDPSRADPDRARSDTLAGLLKLQKIRQDHGLPPLCT